MILDKMTLGRKAKELGFSRDTLEKVCRLAEILKFMGDDEISGITNILIFSCKKRHFGLKYYL